MAHFTSMKIFYIFEQAKINLLAEIIGLFYYGWHTSVVLVSSAAKKYQSRNRLNTLLMAADALTNGASTVFGRHGN